MKHLCKDNLLLYCGLSKLSNEEFNKFLKECNDKTIHDVCSAVFNTVYTDLGLSKFKQNKIKKYLKQTKTRKNLNAITKKDINIKRKRRALLQEGEGIKTVLKTITPLLKVLVNKKQNKQK